MTTQKNLEKICRNCNQTFGKHRSADDACPRPVSETGFRRGFYEDKKFVEDKSKEGYVEYDIVIDGAFVGSEIYEIGREEESEAFREGMMMIAKMTPQEVVITSQFHPHSPENEDCVCAQYDDGDRKVWRNDD